jgi:hypothetical protein
MAEIVRLFIGCAVMAVVCGCGRGGPGTQISGTVTLDGKPLPSGNVAFMPMVGIQGKSTLAHIVNGKYEVTQEHEVVGKHRVEIRADRPMVSNASPVPSHLGPAGRMEQYLPKQYNENSTLSFDIQAGTNVANFTLKSEGR